MRRLKFLPPNGFYCIRYLRIITVTMPRGDNIRLQPRYNCRINERDPTDLRCSRSAVTRGYVSIFGVDNDQAYWSFFPSSPFQSYIQ